jgi:hypothetical protein
MNIVILKILGMGEKWIRSCKHRIKERIAVLIMKSVIHKFRLMIFLIWIDLCIWLEILVIAYHLWLLQISHLESTKFVSIILTRDYIMDGSYWLTMILNRIIMRWVVLVLLHLLLIRYCLKLIVLQSLRL